MTAAEIRQSFLDFFKEKQHTIVPSASLLPQSPGLLFTNAGMNPFVPYFLGVEKAPYDPPRAADTQKCIRAGGKHNDLEDVGYDTYHHTFFEMLGNWSFGNYFKKEAIQWAWELVVERWGLPAHRLHASVYAPQPGDPGEFDQEAWDIWAELYRSKGCDPNAQIVNGNVKDNFWMMGETGPCGPCSELHVNLTPAGDPMEGRLLVNNDSDLCIEIWNLVFIQYNAEVDGSFRELPAKHIDTGMGFERACSIIQGTKGFTDFSNKPSNYATDVFMPIFRKLEELSGKTYSNIYPALGADRSAFTEEMKDAIAFRVIADHLRTLSFSIADGIMPGNNGRNYVLRRILRRAVRYGRQLGFSGDKPFFGALVETLVGEMGSVFPELKNRQDTVRATLEQEEASFNQTLDRGLKRLAAMLEEHNGNWHAAHSLGHVFASDFKANELPGEYVFELYDTYGFPKDLTDLVLAERGWFSKQEGFEREMKLQQERARSAQKSTLVRALDISTDVVTEFVGFDNDSVEATVLEVHEQEDAWLVITDRTPFYAEMGGQVGDSGSMDFYGESPFIQGIVNIGKARGFLLQKSTYTFMQECDEFPKGMHSLVGQTVGLKLDTTRRRPIEAHHTATHLLHWALHEVVSKDAAQQGSSVDENRLRFDFNSGAVTPEQIAEMEEKVNACIIENDAVSWKEVAHASIKGRPDIMQFFGDKYGEFVRVVQIGGGRGDLTGYSMELCGGTHVRNTGEIGLFKIKSEGAIASGVRRIEAVCGEAAWAYLNEAVEKWDADLKAAREKLKAANDKLATLGEAPVPVNDFPHIMGAMLVERADISELNATFAHGQRTLEETKEAAIEAEKRFKKLQAGAAAKQADAALAELIAAGGPIVATFEADASLLQELLNGMKKQGFTGAGFVIVDDGEKLHLGAYCGDAAQASGLKAGDLLRDLAAIAGGKGGGKPDQARGAAPEREKLAELEAAAKATLA
ncbi:alanine--tRNA ligase [Luteolibacter arcticus]|uniref:Alanine--tRNA ligase n=1 Tax=Luteolibacter arcticus TaxID=1581411 RepID=A0ABT3GE65_9BACT|nr:alanine--tRNA ligase [Luteolibacter arcticus]MCW1921912.1 alanine--tRNA ligase [Luteolibacter arcticus]